MARGDHLASTPAGEATNTHEGSARRLLGIRAWLGGHAAVLQQATRLATAATLAMIVVQLFRLPSGFWAPLSALAVVQGQIGASVAAARNYILANVVGVLLGTLIVVSFGKDLPVVGLGIFALALFATALRLPPASVASASAIIPILVLSVQGNPWRYGGFRLLDILVGMAAAVLVSVVVFPGRAAVQLRARVAAALRELTAAVAQALAAVAAGTPPPDSAGLTARVADQLHAADGLLATTRYEPGHHAAAALLPFYLAHGAHIFEHAAALLEDADGTLPPDVRHALAPGLADAATGVAGAGAALAGAIEAGVAGRPVPAAQTALAGLQAAVARLEGVKLTAVAEGDDLLRAYALVAGVSGLAAELDRALRRIERPDEAATPDERAHMGTATPSTPAAHPHRWERRRRVTSDE